MKLTLIVAVLLVVGGVAALLSLSASAASGEMTVDRILSLEEPAKLKAKLVALEVLSEFKPTEFIGVQMPPEELQIGAASQENDAFREYLATAPRVRVRYEGHDKLALERYSHVSLEGKWDVEAQIIRADKMYTKCPSRYEGAGEAPKPGEMDGSKGSAYEYANPGSGETSPAGDVDAARQE